MIRIRISALPYYLDCPRRAAAGLFNFQIKLAGHNIPAYPPQVSALVGRGAHAGARHIVDTMHTMGDRPKLDNAQEIAIVEFRKDVEEGIQYDTVTPNNNHAEEQLQILTQSYYHEIAPGLDVEGLKTEKSYKASFGQADITGHIDFCTPREIRDLKTGREASFIAQLGGYSLLDKSNRGTAANLYVDFTPRVPISKPYPGAKTFCYDKAIAENTAYNIIKKIVRDANEFIETGDPWAFSANPKSMLCGPKYCSCYKTSFCNLGGL